METLKDIQPDVELGGRILLEKMDSPVFPQQLLEVAEKTKWSELNSTLQSSLPVGNALQLWGDGRNPVIKENQLTNPPISPNTAPILKT